MFSTSTKITQDTIRLTGYICSRPELRRTREGDILSWQYYRGNLASDFAAHVAVEFNRKAGSGIVRLVSYDPINRECVLKSSKCVLGSLDDLVAIAAESLDDLKLLTTHKHETNVAAGLLYDNGFLPGDDGDEDTGGRERYWVRNDPYTVDCWHIIRPLTKTQLITNPDDPCEVNFGSIQIGGWTAVRCPNLKSAIGMLDGGVIPRPTSSGFTDIPYKAIMGADA